MPAVILVSEDGPIASAIDSFVVIGEVHVVTVHERGRECRANGVEMMAFRARGTCRASSRDSRGGSAVVEDILARDLCRYSSRVMRVSRRPPSNVMPGRRLAAAMNRARGSLAEL